MSLQSRNAVPFALALLAGFAAAPACSSTTDTPSNGDGGGGSSGSSGGSGSGAGSGGAGSGSSSSGSSASGSSSSGASGGSGASTSGSAGSGSSASGSNSGAASGSNAGSGSVDAGAACGAPTTGGIPLTGQGYAGGGATGVPGMGGYVYAYSDSKPPAGVTAGTSTACVDTTNFCGTVSTGMQNTATWGGGIGVNLNQQGGGGTIGTVAATGTGIKYALSGVSSQGMRILIDNGGTDYCANLPATPSSGTIPWSAFNTMCWLADGGAGLSGPPATATHINFQVNAVATAGTYSFCVTSLAFAP